MGKTGIGDQSVKGCQRPFADEDKQKRRDGLGQWSSVNGKGDQLSHRRR